MDFLATRSLLLVTLGALLTPALARRIAVPVAVAEIAYGLVLGRSGFAWIGVEEHGVLRFVAELGFALFLFVAALEIDVAAIFRGGIRSIALPLGLSTAMLAGALWIGAWLQMPWWLGLAIGVTSVPLAMAVLRELHLLHTPFGRDVLLVAGVGELLSIGLLALFDVGADARTSGVVGLVFGVLRALIPVAGIVATAVVLRSLVWWFPTPFQRFAAAEDPQELGVRAGFFLMFAGIAIAAIGGLEPLLGAFFAGLVVTYVVRSREVLEQKLGGVAYGFFVPCFFVNVGARLDVDPETLRTNAPLIACVVLAMVLSRVPVFAGYAASGLGLRSAGAAALLLSAPLTLQIAVVDLGVRKGILAHDVEAAVIIAAVVAGVTFPALARRLLVAPSEEPAAA